MTESHIQAAELAKSYGDVRALDGLSLEIAAGSVFALLGPNGAGKSTTVKILSTLSRPDSGSARVAGFDVLREPERVRGAIGLVGQKASSDPLATARENLVLAGLIQGMPHARQRADELLERFELPDRLAKTFSGGMARKLDVAIGLMHRPRVLFLDEPTTGLDPEARSEMWAEIGRLAADEAVTVLLTTHYLDEADRLADRIAIVDHGRIVVEGSPDALKAQLRGDTVQVHLDAQYHDAASALLSRAGLREVAGEHGNLRGRADDGARAVPAVLTALEVGGIAVDSVTVSRPSLDDVYLRYAGRSFEVAA